MDKAKGFLSKYAMLVILALVMLFFQVTISSSGKGDFFSPANITNLLSQNGYVVILATGMLLCILTGGNIDLSVGSVIVLVGALSGILIVQMGLNPYLSILLCLIAGTAIGAWQAFLIAYIRIPPFITTLGGMLIFRGLALFLLGSKGISFSRSQPSHAAFLNLFNSYIPGTTNVVLGGFVNVSLIIALAVCVVMVALQTVSRRQKVRKGYTVENMAAMVTRLTVISGVIMFAFHRLGQDKGVPVLLIWLGAIVLIYNYFTQNTVPGRYLYAMGGNAKAARLSGVNTKKMMFFAYTNMGFLAGIAALVYTARFAQAGTTAGSGVELDAIGACFIGGASAYGGIGTVGGAVIGAVFMGVLNMGMSIMGVDQNLQRVIKGLVLLAAVIFDVLSKNRKQSG